jgi:hypothetical protein
LSRLMGRVILTNFTQTSIRKIQLH